MREIGIGVAALLLGALIGFAGDKVDFSKKVEDALPPALVEKPHPFCHDGWEPELIEAEHVISLLCHRDDVTVILNVDGSFNLAEQNGQFMHDETAVPGW